jgi:hypothetical protein
MIPRNIFCSLFAGAAAGAGTLAALGEWQARALEKRAGDFLTNFFNSSIVVKELTLDIGAGLPVTIRNVTLPLNNVEVQGMEGFTDSAPETLLTMLRTGFGVEGTVIVLTGLAIAVAAISLYQSNKNQKTNVESPLLPPHLSNEDIADIEAGQYSAPQPM